MHMHALRKRKRDLAKLFIYTIIQLERELYENTAMLQLSQLGIDYICSQKGKKAEKWLNINKIYSSFYFMFCVTTFNWDLCIYMVDQSSNQNYPHLAHLLHTGRRTKTYCSGQMDKSFGVSLRNCLFFCLFSYIRTGLSVELK